MDQGTLVEMQIDQGKRLIDRLAEEGVAVTAAGWLRESESGQWFMYLVTPLVGEDGATKAAYRRILGVIREMPPPFWIDPLEIKAVGPTDPLARGIVAVSRRGSGPRAHPLRWAGARLGDVNSEGAYLYPLPAGTSS